MRADYTGTITVNPSDVKFENINSYDLISITGYDYYKQTGYPQVPMQKLRFIIPKFKKVTNVAVTNISETELTGDFNIYPSQPEQIMSGPINPFISPYPTVYNLNQLYPAANFIMDYTTGLRGAKIFQLFFCPVRYNPVTKKVYLITSIQYSLTYADDAANISCPLNMSETAQNINKNILAANVCNQQDIDAYYSFSKSNINEVSQVIIITKFSLQANFLKLADTLTKYGIPAKVYIETDYDASHFPNCLDEQERIRKLIQSKFIDDGSIQHIILGGNASIIQPRIVRWANFTTGLENIATDTYFASIEDNGAVHAWNGDEIMPPVYGEINDGVDQLVDFSIGRIPVGTPEEADAFLLETVLNFLF
ncbi:MAG: hypothetical protein A2491_03025 [Bacteroidetes bacterium RIFOXYC12_FULL_35_7]|nr:MAG: hypothetical protein A2491_03025 [Bacteroidetes bacterium RIFOXYC12_FULL_35_7]